MQTSNGHWALRKLHRTPAVSDNVYNCRTLAIAYRDVFLPFQTDANRDEFSAAQLERELTLVALVGIADPLREEVPAAIEACHRAGISVRMLTGMMC